MRIDLIDTDSQTLKTSKTIKRDERYFRKSILFVDTTIVLFIHEKFPITAVINPFGILKISRMAFKLKNWARTFEMISDSVLKDVNFLYIYLKDILVFSKYLEELLEQHNEIIPTYTE
ncbi:hypothetical protein RF11_01041 [Thelohanellus kitauei]|uniref:Reverse transcriptase domain-containing protein n=1 Tax=Thelohanellus kitauei TaxID=669202 RepID=A0A0C2ME57_THEKT|nr:hypothetical protein RF11_01041 [Thelohanellus kitauei]